MLISILRTDGVKEVYDCARFSMVDSEDLKEHVSITFEGMKDGAVTVHYYKPTTSVYVMNDQGKTVETYRWS